MKRWLMISAVLCLSTLVMAGGNPEYVPFPQNYRSTFTLYDTINRGNGKQLAMLYANDIAYNSANAGSNSLANGSKIVMEVYKAKVDANGEPIMGADGLLEKGKFAAVAVMEKKPEWPQAFASNERAGDWGFAIYQTDGKPKANDLDCATCHQPLQDQAFMFSHPRLVDFVIHDK